MSRPYLPLEMMHDIRRENLSGYVGDEFMHVKHYCWTYSSARSRGIKTKPLPRSIDSHILFTNRISYITSEQCQLISLHSPTNRAWSVGKNGKTTVKHGYAVWDQGTHSVVQLLVETSGDRAWRLAYAVQLINKRLEKENRVSVADKVDSLWSIFIFCHQQANHSADSNQFAGQPIWVLPRVEALICQPLSAFDHVGKAFVSYLLLSRVSYRHWHSIYCDTTQLSKNRSGLQQAEPRS